MIVYTIVGIPVSLVKTSQASRKVLSSYNLCRLNQQNQLREQHGDIPLLSGLHNLDVEFHFDHEYSKSRGYSPHKPALSSLLKYLDDILHGVVYESEYIVYNVNAEKFYDVPTSKTVLKFSKKDKDGKKNT